MIIGDADRWGISNDFPEIPTETQPMAQMITMVIHLVTCEKQEVRFNFFHIVDNILPGNMPAMRSINRIARKRSHNETDTLFEQAGIDYQPLVFESFGGLCGEGRETLKSINRLVAQNTNTPCSEVAHRFWQRVSVEKSI